MANCVRHFWGTAFVMQSELIVEYLHSRELYDFHVQRHNMASTVRLTNNAFQFKATWSNQIDEQDWHIQKTCFQSMLKNLKFDNSFASISELSH